MSNLKYFILAIVVAAGLVIPASAQQADHQATTPPLVQLLQSKGILTAAEAAQVSQASSAEEANSRLAQMLLAKGLISESDYNSTVGPLVNAAGMNSANGGHFMNSVLHVPSKDSYDAADGSGNGSPGDDQPASIHFKGITLTPGGFLAGTTTWRQRAISAANVTPFNSVPFSTYGAGNISEFNTDARQSLISLLAEGHVGGTRLRGYYESDFQSAGVTSNNSSTNGYTLRVRQAWGQAALDSGWTFTAGQMWTLITANKSGVDPLTEYIPMTIDGGYTVGFIYARQEGFRVTKSLLDKKLFLAMSVENPELNSVAGNACSAGSCIYGEGGNATGILNVVTTGVEAQNYSFNATPDFIFKAAIEPGWGHYEVFGLVNTFHERFYPCFNATALVPCTVNKTIITPSSFGATNRTTTGGGVGVNAYGSTFDHHLDVNFSFMGGNGTGRYSGAAALSGIVFNANQEMVPLRNYQGFFGFVLHATPKLDIYLYGGGDYLQKTWTYAQSIVAGVPTPFTLEAGCITEQLPASDVSPGAGCNAATRDILEGTLGFWYKFYNGPYGRLQAGVQYSYVNRDTWSGNIVTTTGVTTPDGARIPNGGVTVTTTPFAPKAIDNMIFTAIRYYLP